jgi:GNAT superfamily N-acetyltransferase
MPKKGAIHVTCVDPRSVAGAASRVLTDAWPPPCLVYSPGCLAWQLGFPGQVEARAVLATDGDEPVGFAGSTPRRVWFKGEAHEIHIVSFVAVRPPWQGMGLSGQLYRTLLASLREAGATVVTFAQPDSAGEHALVRAYGAAQFVVRTLAPHLAYGYRPTGISSALRAREVEPPTLLECVRPADEGVLWWAPDAREAAHLRSDPRRRQTLVLEDDQGHALAGGTAVEQDLSTGGGATKVASLETVYLAEPEPERLRGLCEAVTRLHEWPSGAVTATSLATLTPDLVRSAGLRRLPAGFHAYLCSASRLGPMAEVRATNLPVV